MADEDIFQELVLKTNTTSGGEHEKLQFLVARFGLVLQWIVADETEKVENLVNSVRAKMASVREAALVYESYTAGELGDLVSELEWAGTGVFGTDLVVSARGGPLNLVDSFKNLVKRRFMHCGTPLKIDILSPEGTEIVLTVGFAKVSEALMAWESFRRNMGRELGCDDENKHWKMLEVGFSKGGEVLNSSHHTSKACPTCNSNKRNRDDVSGKENQSLRKKEIEHKKRSRKLDSEELKVSAQPASDVNLVEQMLDKVDLIPKTNEPKEDDKEPAKDKNESPEPEDNKKRELDGDEVSPVKVARSSSSTRSARSISKTGNSSRKSKSPKRARSMSPTLISSVPPPHAGASKKRSLDLLQAQKPRELRTLEVLHSVEASAKDLARVFASFKGFQSIDVQRNLRTQDLVGRSVVTYDSKNEALQVMQDLDETEFPLKSKSLLRISLLESSKSITSKVFKGGKPPLAANPPAGKEGLSVSSKSKDQAKTVKKKKKDHHKRALADAELAKAELAKALKQKGAKTDDLAESFQEALGFGSHASPYLGPSPRSQNMQPPQLIPTEPQILAQHPQLHPQVMAQHSHPQMVPGYYPMQPIHMQQGDPYLGYPTQAPGYLQAYPQTYAQLANQGVPAGYPMFGNQQHYQQHFPCSPTPIQALQAPNFQYKSYEKPAKAEKEALPTQGDMEKDEETAGENPENGSRLIVKFGILQPEDQIRKLFKEAAPGLEYVSKHSTRTYAFVKYTSGAAAKLARLKLDNLKVSGHPLSIDIAEPHPKLLTTRKRQRNDQHQSNKKPSSN